MKCSDPDTVGAYSHKVFHTFLHLSGGLIGKRNRHDVPGIYSQFIYQIRNSVSKHSGLSRTSSRKQQDRSLCGKNTLFLLFI